MFAFDFEIYNYIRVCLVVVLKGLPNFAVREVAVSKPANPNLCSILVFQPLAELEDGVQLVILVVVKEDGLVVELEQLEVFVTPVGASTWVVSREFVEVLDGVVFGQFSCPDFEMTLGGLSFVA